MRLRSDDSGNDDSGGDVILIDTTPPGVPQPLQAEPSLLVGVFWGSVLTAPLWAFILWLLVRR